MTEVLGYIAMGFVGISFLMKNILTLRLLNLIGAATFIVYGIMLNEPPIYILNAFIVVVNLYYLLKKPKTLK